MDNITGLEIAVIGMAGRFPGARNIPEFWENLKQGKETVSYFSPAELAALAVDPQILNDPAYVKAASILENIEYFDAPFFGYTPREAELMAPQMRIFHEEVYHAFEDAGYVPYTYNYPTGLYAGSSTTAHWEALAFLSGKRAIFGEFAANLLADKDQLSTRISYNLNLKGPSFTLSTACSTSLTAIHLAAQGLLSGECKMAAAGGVTATIPRNYGYLYQEGSILSPDGHSRSFADRANGSALGEGAGVVILKSLEDALADGDFIYAVIKGSAVNNDGSGKVGYTAPGAQGQAQVIRAALHAAEVDAESIGYIETHGTATKMGDSIEIQALKMAFNSDKKGFCRIGSVKSNVGHLVHAAGVTGFIKTVLILFHKLIPPSLHYEVHNPAIDLENSPFIVNHELFDWKDESRPRRAGVSSFGIGGTNVHVVLEEWRDKREKEKKGDSREIERQYSLILLSAKNPAALDKMTDNLVSHFKNNDHIAIADAAYTLQQGRMVYPYRRMAVCRDLPEAAASLAAPSETMKTFHAKEEKNTIVFMFPGLGAQYVNMGLGLYNTESLFRQEIDRCFGILKPLLGYDLKEIMYPGLSPGETNGSYTSYLSHDRGFDRPETAQLALFVFEYALARLLMACGVKPAIMIGYSFGEYTAAVISGVFSLPDALAIIAARGRLIGSIPPGLMLSAPLAAGELQPYLNEKISISIDNGPSCIVSGPPDELVALETRLKAERYLCLRLPNTHAIHSPMMEPILDDFERLIRGFELKTPNIPYVSNVTGERITDAQARDPVYWRNHLRETVHFAPGIERLRREPNPIFIEIGPGRDLSALLARYKQEQSEIRTVNLVRPQQKEADDEYYLLTKIGRLWLYGVPIDWQTFYQGEKRQRIPLPHYPYTGKPYWIDGASLNIQPGLSLANPLPQGRREDEQTAGITGSLYERPIDIGSAYTPPTDALEQSIVAVWQECFGISPIGIDDDFFELGGDSLLAGTMVSRLNRETGIPLPLAEVFNLLTIKKIAAYARDHKITAGAPLGENLLFLKASRAADAPNLFCIHDISGEAAGYIEFCNRLEIDFNSWGLQADRIKDYTPQNLTVQELARRYLEVIRSLQPTGPYYLLGWSFGGYVAFEMARLLEQQDETIAFFAAVDAFVFQDETIATGNDFTLQSELNWLQEYLPSQARDLKEKLAKISTLDELWPLILTYLESGEFTAENLKKILPENMPSIVPNFDRLTPGQLIFSLNMLRTFNRALNTYIPSGKIDTAIHFFKAARQLWQVRTDHWETSSTKGVTFYEVPGDHFSIFRRLDVVGLANIFAKVFKKATG